MTDVECQAGTAAGVKFSSWYRLGLLRCSSFQALPGVLQAVAFAVGFEDMDAVGQPVEQRPGQALCPQHFSPGFERQVGGDDQAGAFRFSSLLTPALANLWLAQGKAPRHQEYKQQLRPGLGARDITQFIKDEQVQALQVLISARASTSPISGLLRT